MSDDNLSSDSSSEDSIKHSISDLSPHSSSSYEKIPINSHLMALSEEELIKIEDLGLNEVDLPIKTIAEAITKLHFNIALNDTLFNYPLALKFLNVAKQKYKNMLQLEKKRFKQHEFFIIEYLLQQRNDIQVLTESTRTLIKKDIDKFSRIMNTHAIVRSSLSKIAKQPYLKKVKLPLVSKQVNTSSVITTIFVIGIIVIVIYQLIKLNILGGTLKKLVNTLNALSSTVNGTLQSLNATVNNALLSVDSTVNSVAQSLQNNTQALSNIQNSVDTLYNATNNKLDNILSQCKILP